MASKQFLPAFLAPIFRHYPNPTYLPPKFHLQPFKKDCYPKYFPSNLFPAHF